MTNAQTLDLVKHRVLFLSEVINCNDGIASYCETLASGLRRDGIEVFLYTGEVRSDEKSQAKRDLLAAAVKEWHVLDKIGKFPTPSVIWTLRDAIIRNRIEVIHVHGLGMLLIGRVLATLTGLRLVGTYHQSILGGLNHVLRNSKRKFGVVQELFLNLASPDALVVLSDESVEFIRSHRIYFGKRVVKVLGSADLSHFRPPSPEERQAVRERLGLGQDDYVCILAARLAWVKGHDILVKAVRQLRARRPDLPVRCLFVGSGGPQREQEIKSVAHENAADEASFRFLGFASDVRDALWASDVFVLPSRFEGFALGVVEAMATGLVPVRTPSGGARDQIVEGRTGFLTPFEDADALAAILERLSDPELRRTVSKGAIAHATENFGVDRMISAMMHIYGFEDAGQVRL